MDNMTNGETPHPPPPICSQWGGYRYTFPVYTRTKWGCNTSFAVWRGPDTHNMHNTPGTIIRPMVPHTNAWSVRTGYGMRAVARRTPMLRMLLLSSVILHLAFFVWSLSIYGWL